MAYQFKTSFGAAGLAAGSTQMDLPRRLTNEISGTSDIDLFQVLRKGDYLYGVDNNVIIGIIAGGDDAIRNSIEGAEDDLNQAWKDLLKYHINNKDSVIGITASGRTPSRRIKKM